MGRRSLFVISHAPKVNSLHASAHLKRFTINYAPMLATIPVGSDPSSVTYLRVKGNARQRVGMGSKSIELPESSSTSDVLAAIDAPDTDTRVQGILLQHRAPKRVDDQAGSFAQIRRAEDNVLDNLFGG